jgi:DNA polymerase III subunit delta'
MVRRRTLKTGSILPKSCLTLPILFDSLRRKIMPGFEQLCGQDHVIRILKRSIERDQLAHAYLFHGESGLGMEAGALALAAASLCKKHAPQACGECGTCKKVARLDHPDLRLILPLPSMPSGKEDTDPAVHFSQKQLVAYADFMKEPWHPPTIDGARQISVAQSRHLKQWASLKSFEGGARVAVIFNAERMGVQAQNALLKLLEEPPKRMHLILVSSDPESLLPTILSRCQQMRFRPVETHTLAAYLEKAGYPHQFQPKSGTTLPSPLDLARMSAGNHGQARAMLQSLLEGEDDLWRPDSFLRDLLKRNPADLHNRIVSFEGSKDRSRIEHFLDDLEMWMQDVDLLNSLSMEKGRALLRFPHHSQSLAAFSSHFQIINPKDLSELFLSTKRLLNRNIHLFILLVQFAQKLGHHIQALSKDTA